MIKKLSILFLLVFSFIHFVEVKSPFVLAASLPSGIAVFETSLASPITSTATSMTLTANSIRGGGSISGYNCFTVDEGSAQAETMCGTVSGTAVTSITRGISQATGTSTVSALQFSHRRGANVKITDFPLIQILKLQNNGEETFPNQIIYASGVTPTNTSALVDKEYVDGLAFSGAGVVDATSIAKGVVELATGAEASASTAVGSSGNLVLPASIASSTYNSATASNIVVVTKATGKIDDNFLSSSIVSTSTMARFATSSINVGSFPAYNIGKNIQVFSTTGTSTFSVPSGVTKVKVQVVGGGGGGGGGADNGRGGSGGGGGGYALEYVDVSATSSVQVFVGSGGAGGSAGDGADGTWSTFGTNGFYLYATGGGGAGTGSSSCGTGNCGGPGGSGSGGDLNTQGGGGISMEDNGVEQAAGAGGSSFFGSGAPGLGGVNDFVGITGGNYGGGGGGGVGDNGGAGGQGVVIIEW